MKKIFLLSPFSIMIVFPLLSQNNANKIIFSGKTVYDKHCLSCHQADGNGVPNMNPPLSKVSWVTGSKEILIKLVLNGVTTPMEIEGELYHNPMPSHQHLSDQEIADVLTYIRTNFGNKAIGISKDEVTKVRSNQDRILRK